MVSSTALAVSAASLLFSLPANAGLYTKNSAVLQLTAKNYDSLITKSNHTSIVEFYAPWCGHCQNLKPAYEKVAKNLAGLAKVAAVDCDDEDNKPLCGRMGVKGFPTLKIVRPNSKPGKQPVVEDYQGARAAKAIADAVVDKIPNHVKKVDDKGLESWLSTGNDTAKALLFTDKGTTSALLRALAIDYLGSVSFGQVRNKEKTAVSTFGITKFPTLVILPGGDQEGIVYDGAMKKEAMSAFVKEASKASPNPDPAPSQPKKKATKAKDAPKTKKEPKKEPKKESKEDSKEESKKESKKGSEDGECPMGHDKKDKKDSHTMKMKDSSFKLDDINESDEKVEVPDAKVQGGPPMPTILETAEQLQKECLAPKSHVCILALLPKTESGDEAPEAATQALISIGEVHYKHPRLPLYFVPADNELGQKVRETLKLRAAAEIELIAVNSKRSWYRRCPSFLRDDVETWFDAVRMNDGPRETLPESLVGEAEAPKAEAAKDAEPPKEEQPPVVEEEVKADEEFVVPPEPEAQAPVHNEL